MAADRLECSHCTTSHCTISHHVVPQHIAPHHIVHRITPHNIIPHRMTPHCTTYITPHHVVHHTVPYRTTPHHVCTTSHCHTKILHKPSSHCIILLGATVSRQWTNQSGSEPRSGEIDHEDSQADCWLDNEDAGGELASVEVEQFQPKAADKISRAWQPQ